MDHDSDPYWDALVTERFPMVKRMTDISERAERFLAAENGGANSREIITGLRDEILRLRAAVAAMKERCAAETWSVDQPDNETGFAAAETQANARLISAAPEMAEALAKKPSPAQLNDFMNSDLANAVAEKFPEVGVFLGAYSMWCIQADAAFAKARGGT